MVGSFRAVDTKKETSSFLCNFRGLLRFFPFSMLQRIKAWYKIEHGYLVVLNYTQNIYEKFNPTSSNKSESAILICSTVLMEVIQIVGNSSAHVKCSKRVQRVIVGRLCFTFHAAITLHKVFMLSKTRKPVTQFKRGMRQRTGEILTLFAPVMDRKWMQKIFS